MGPIQWSDKYSVGGTMIDAHHKKLIDYINMIDGMIREDNTTNDLLNHIFFLLEQYTDHHFSLEEKFMSENAYPDFRMHKSEHDNFKSEIAAFAEVAEKGVGAVDARMANYLKGWLLSHIMTSDQQYADYFKGKGIPVP